jgi:hypothetical protein
MKRLLHAREQDDGTLERAIEENVSLFGTEEHALALAALRG